VPRDGHLGHPVALVIPAVRADWQQAGHDEHQEQGNRKRKDQNIH
jgi:hypothetical protein